jgi:hypothetical protein
MVSVKSPENSVVMTPISSKPRAAPSYQSGAQLVGIIRRGAAGLDCTDEQYGASIYPLARSGVGNLSAKYIRYHGRQAKL